MERQIVTLCLGKEVFAIPVEYVQEILEHRDTFALPDGPAWLCGLIDVRGRGVPVIDLRSKLGLPKIPPTAATRIMVIELSVAGKPLAFGLVADRVLEVLDINDGKIEPAPDVGVPWRSDYIAGVMRRDEGFVVLLNVEVLMTTVDATTIGALLGQAA